MVQLSERELVPELVLLVLVAVLLNSVVGEVDVHVLEIPQCVLLTRSSDVSLLEKVKLEVVGHKRPNSNVKLSAFDQQRSFYVLLDNEGRGSNKARRRLLLLRLNELRFSLFVLFRILGLFFPHH